MKNTDDLYSQSAALCHIYQEKFLDGVSSQQAYNLSNLMVTYSS